MITRFDAVYSAVAVLGSPFWLYKLLTDARYRHRLGDRFGRYPVPPAGEPRLWIHAASMGEVRSAQGLVRELRGRFPNLSLTVSTFTVTGWEQARKLYPEALVVKFPLDFSWMAGWALDRIRPDAVVVIESDFWPNFIQVASKRNIPLLWASASVSERSFERYRKLKKWLWPVFSKITWMGAAGNLDEWRFRRLGVAPERIEILGNLKWDLPPVEARMHDCGAEPEIVRWVRDWKGKAPLWVAGSTHEGEEEILLDAFDQLRKEFPSLRLVLAPRHPERFDTVANLIERKGIPFIRRSRWQGESRAEPLVLLDSMGELDPLYFLCDVALVGGSLVPGIGGHNVLEPIRYAKPVLFGPHATQFLEECRQLIRAEAAVTVADANDLRETLERWLREPERRERLGKRGREWLDRQAGMTRSYADRVGEALQGKILAQRGTPPVQR